MTIFEFLKILNEQNYDFELKYDKICSIEVLVHSPFGIEIFTFSEEDGKSIVDGVVIYKEHTRIDDNSELTQQIEKLINPVQKVFKQAAKDLNIRIEMPFIMKEIDGEKYSTTAYLPDFGEGKGVLICLMNENIESLILEEMSKEYFISIISPTGYCEYNREDFIASLVDWGWNGKGNPPEWFISSTRD